MNAVIMGRKTWESLPERCRPLPDRLNVVLSRGDPLVGVNDDTRHLISVFKDLDLALESLSSDPQVNEIFVIGGSTVYELAINRFTDYCKLIIMTRINKHFEADVFMPAIDEENTFTKLFISKTYSHQDINFDYCFIGNKKLLSLRPELVPTRLMAKYPKHPEMQYLEIIKDIIDNGETKDDRTGVGVVGKFGY